MTAAETPISLLLSRISGASDESTFDSRKLFFATVPVPVVSAARVYAQRSQGSGLAWAEGEQALIGLGSICELRARGSGRFEELRRQSRELWKQIETDPEAGGFQPRLFGGFSFQPGGADSPEWEEFGDAHFVLPLLSYWTDGRSAKVGILISGGSQEAWSSSELRQEVVGLFKNLLLEDQADPCRGRLSVPPQSGQSATDLKAPQREAFEEGVSQITRAIDKGLFSKVVTARCSHWTLDEAVEPAVVWERLCSGSDSGSATFSFQFDEATFLGSTPERLLELEGRELYTEAIAGTLPADKKGNEERLLASAKDREEHAFVFHELQQRLGKISKKISFSETPSIKRLHYALHLHTPFRVILDGDEDIFQLLQLLHPTPAVAGQPSAEASQWIFENEEVERGWYAGPVGWMTPDGDGTFWVALRSGLLSSRSARLYAGAGIVRDSDPASEYAETELKLQPLLEALGARR